MESNRVEIDILHIQYTMYWAYKNVYKAIIIKIAS